VTRFFFHIDRGGSMYADVEGRSFSDLKRAKVHAATLAREIAQHGGDYVDCWVCIADKQGNEWGRVSIGSDVTRVD
jgi:hypothetical protein